jgi:hypothetical protein
MGALGIVLGCDYEIPHQQSQMGSSITHPHSRIWRRNDQSRGVIMPLCFVLLCLVSRMVTYGVSVSPPGYVEAAWDVVLEYEWGRE